MQNIFDSHAHYDDPRFDEDRDALLGSMAEHGVSAIMNVGNTTHANLAGIELAKQYPFIYFYFLYSSANFLNKGKDFSIVSVFMQ